MVNFKAYRAGEDTFEAFKEDKLYQMVIKGEKVPIENKDSDKIIIDK